MIIKQFKNMSYYPSVSFAGTSESTFAFIEKFYEEFLMGWSIVIFTYPHMITYFAFEVFLLSAAQVIKSIFMILEFFNNLAKVIYKQFLYRQMSKKLEFPLLQLNMG